MKKILFAACLLFSFHSYAQQTKKVVYIIADGIPADVIERLDLPNLHRIIKAGTYVRMHVGGDKGTYNQTPTISAPGYNDLLTGTWGNKHNVPDNAILAPNYNYHSIFRLLKDQYPDKKIGVFSSWTDNRTKLIGEGLPATGNLKMDYHADGYELDTVNFKQDKARDFMHNIDERVVAEAVKSIQTDAPDLSWVYLEYTDDMGHGFGDSPQFYRAVTLLDAQIGKIYEAILAREKTNKEEWLLVLTTDHGRDEKTGRNHGGQSDRQRTTWMITNNKNLNTYAHTYDPAIVDILPTMARFLQVDLSRTEVDGTPLTGAVSIADAKLNFIQNNIDISWKALEETGSVKIWVTTTNNFKTGGKDEYHLLGEVPVAGRHAFLDVKEYPSKFYKIILQAPDNTLNKWLVLE